MAISGGLEKSLKVNKWGGAAISGGGGWKKVNVYGLGCYKWMWREDQHMHWTNNFNFLKKKLLRLLHISYIYLIRYKNVSIIVVDREEKRRGRKGTKRDREGIQRQSIGQKRKIGERREG